MFSDVAKNRWNTFSNKSEKVNCISDYCPVTHQFLVYYVVIYISEGICDSLSILWPKAAAIRGTFLLVQATQHFFVVLKGHWNQNAADEGSATKSLGWCYIIFVEFKKIASAFTCENGRLGRMINSELQNIFEDFKLAVWVESCKCSRCLKYLSIKKKWKRIE